MLRVLDVATESQGMNLPGYCFHTPFMHPGKLIREDLLPALGVSKTKLAQSPGISWQTLYTILNERQPVAAEMAIRFGKLFGNDACFWVNMQQAFDFDGSRNEKPQALQHA